MDCSSLGAWATWQNPASTEIENISRVWWHMPVIPATWVGGGRVLRWEDSLILGGQGCSEPRLCHYSLAWVTEQDFVLKKKKAIKRKGNERIVWQENLFMLLCSNLVSKTKLVYLYPFLR